MATATCQIRHCAYCLCPVDAKSVKLCGKCVRRAYCSKTCQTLDWKDMPTPSEQRGQRHKDWCGISVGEEDLDWKVVAVEGKGLGIVALRNIPAKYRIMVEAGQIGPSCHPKAQELMPHGGTLQEKFILNELGCAEEDDENSVLCVRIARVNHSCDPNAVHFYDNRLKVKVNLSMNNILRRFVPNLATNERRFCLLNAISSLEKRLALATRTSMHFMASTPPCRRNYNDVCWKRNGASYVRKIVSVVTKNLQKQSAEPKNLTKRSCEMPKLQPALNLLWGRWQNCCNSMKWSRHPSWIKRGRFTMVSKLELPNANITPWLESTSTNCVNWRGRLCIQKRKSFCSIRNGKKTSAATATTYFGDRHFGLLATTYVLMTYLYQ